MRVLATLTVTAALLGASAPALAEGMRFNFSGFGQDYDIAYGIRETNFAIYPTSSNSLYYANFFFPGDQPPPFGGAVALSGNGKDLGLGFISAFSSKSDDDAVGVAGHAKCKYPKKRKG